jgi:hypothetical protein
MDKIAGATSGFNRDVEHGVHKRGNLFNERENGSILVGIAF